ncbi:MAG: DUF423 domain-containing protein [Bacteroidota bacterium]
MYKKLFIVGISGVITVALGAFAAHGLEDKLTDYQKQVFETASDYQFFHTLAMLGVLLLQQQWDNRFLNYVFNTFLIGIILFSGSLYLLACADILDIAGFKFILGPITPIGGTGLIIGWSLLSFAAYKGIKSKDGVQ